MSLHVSPAPFFFNDTATTEIYTLSLHDALPISAPSRLAAPVLRPQYRVAQRTLRRRPARPPSGRSEEHTSELQSRFDLVCRLLLEKKKIRKKLSSIRTKPFIRPGHDFADSVIYR